MSNRETLIHAAELLEREAHSLALNFTTPAGRWDGDDVGVQADHADMLKTARALREMAESPPQGAA